MMKQNQIIPFSFFDAQGVKLSNYSVGDIILESSPIKEGFSGIIKDNDTIFTTSGGSVHYKIKYASGGSATFRQAVATDDSGFINKILHAGDRVQIVLASTGVGVLDIIWHGELRQIRDIPKFDISDYEEDDL